MEVILEEIPQDTETLKLKLYGH